MALTCMGWSLESGGGRCITLDQPMTRVPVSGAPVLWLGFRVLRPAEVLDRLPWVREILKLPIMTLLSKKQKEKQLTLLRTKSVSA